jgi:hypothetical protein
LLKLSLDINGELDNLRLRWVVASPNGRLSSIRLKVSLKAMEFLPEGA